MFPYILTFIASIVSSNISENCLRLRRNGYYFFRFIAILLPVLLAAFRKDTIGTDLQFYLPTFDDATNFHGKFLDYVEYNPMYETFFLGFNYLCSYLFTSHFLYLFLLHILIICPAYQAAVNLRKILNPAISFFLFLLIFYNDSLNILRQVIAISFVLLASSHLFLRNKNKYLLYTAIAILFHKTALLSLITGAFFLFLKKYPYYNNKFKYLLILGILGGSILSVTIIVSYFVNLDFISAHYIAYTEDSMHYEGRLSSSTVIVQLLVIFYIWFRMKSIKKNRLTELFFVSSIIAFIFNLSGLIIIYLYRIMFYSHALCVFSIPYFSGNRISRTNHSFARLFFLFLFIAMWFFSFVYHGVSATVPYESIL